MKKSDLIRAVSRSQKLPRHEVERVVNATFATISTALALGDEVGIHGFGVFCEKSLPGLSRENPITKIPMDIPPRKSVGFRPSDALKRRMNRS